MYWWLGSIGLAVLNVWLFVWAGERILEGVCGCNGPESDDSPVGGADRDLTDGV